MLISEITGSTLDYPIPYKKVMFIFITFHLLIFQMSWYLVHKALAHRNTWPTHNNTSHVASVTNGIKQFVKCCIFGPTACCLVDYRMYSVNYFIYSYIRRNEGNVLFKDALNTFYLRLYGVRHMVNDHSDSKRGNLLPLHGLLFQISSKCSFICTISHTG